MDHAPHQGQDEPPALRVVLLDGHEVSRAACRALLRPDGVNVVADHVPDWGALALVARASPDAVIVDVSPGDAAALALARRLRRTAPATGVVLTSSAEHSAFNGRLDGFPFLAKGELCSAQVRHALAEARASDRTSSVAGRFRARR